jgi:acyl-CoA thioester hydrolase
MNDSAFDRANYRYYLPITTRWMDNDLYGHVNNVTYYAYFDSIANTYLIQEGGLDIHAGPAIGYVVSSQCSYKSPIAFPEPIEGALRVNRLGNSSVEYGLAIFKPGEERACAAGTFTHVFVARENDRPTPIPPPIREALQQVLVPA